MNKRQQKKRLKKALEWLNEIELYESDYESEGVLYILVEDDQYSREIISDHCGLLGIDKGKFLSDCLSNVDSGYIDLVYGFYFWKEPKGYAVFHSSKRGFLLKKYDEKEVN